MAISFYVLAGFLRRDRRSNEARDEIRAARRVQLRHSGLWIFDALRNRRLDESERHCAHRSRSARPDDLLRGPRDRHRFAWACFFKMAAVPFHQWAPDVYEGAPTPITAYVSVASKTASFALLLRLFLDAFLAGARGLDAADHGAWRLLSLTVGNLAAITQTNVKRLLAYSSIAHVGYILLGLGAPATQTRPAGHGVLFVRVRVLPSGAFAIVIVLRRKGMIGDEIDDLNGLIQRNPGAAVLMLIFLLSLAGIPPTAGFVGKLLIFWALIETGHYTLAVLAVLYILPARVLLFPHGRSNVAARRRATSSARSFPSGNRWRSQPWCS